ncbi:MAG: class I SAM-dependent methyltransferase [Bacteroidetes bacterium]|nr:class I SAM-dependent methyltransferase [Bacteroidota bacterium]
MKEFWDQRFGQEEFIYGKTPNQFFKDQLQGLKPAKLLLPCEGEGRNAVFAATQHWEVDAFDQSSTGKQKAEQLAKEFNVHINYQLADAIEFDYGENKYDAIALIYAHFPESIRKQIHQKCVKALKPGGLLLIEAFNPLQLNNNSGGPKSEDLLYTMEMLAQDFKGMHFQLLRNESIVLEEGEFHKGLANVLRMIAKK